MAIHDVIRGIMVVNLYPEDIGFRCPQDMVDLDPEDIGFRYPQDMVFPRSTFLLK